MEGNSRGRRCCRDSDGYPLASADRWVWFVTKKGLRASGTASMKAAAADLRPPGASARTCPHRRRIRAPSGARSLAAVAGGPRFPRRPSPRTSVLRGFPERIRRGRRRSEIPPKAFSTDFDALRFPPKRSRRSSTVLGRCDLRIRSRSRSWGLAILDSENGGRQAHARSEDEKAEDARQLVTLET